MSRHAGRATRWVGNGSGGRGPRWPRIAAAVALTAFLALAVVARSHPYLSVDLAATRAVQTVPSHLGLVLIGMSWLGYAPQSYALAATATLALAAGGLRREAALALFAGGVVVAGNLVKLLVQRPRPDPELVQVLKALAPWGFPSGHVVTFTAFGGYLAFLARTRTRREPVRVAILVLFLVADALMGLSRMYVGDHWLTDVLGGYLLGGLWLAVTIALFRRHVPGRATAAAALLAMVALGAGARVAMAADARGAAPDSLPMDALRATTAPPWNPPAALPRRRAWEQVVQAPARVLSLPLTAAGELLERGLFWVERSGRISLAPRVGARHDGGSVTLGPPGLGDFAGFGASLQARQSVLHGRLRGALELRLAKTAHRYDQVRVAVTGRPLALEAGDEWRPQDRFYGLGAAAHPSAGSAYSTRTRHLRAVVRAEWDRRADGRPRRRVEAWVGPRRVETGTGRDEDRPSLERVFPALAADVLDRPVEHLASGARVTADWRAGDPHWSRGGRVLVAAERFDDPVRGLALSSARASGARFTRVTVEGEAGTSMGRDPRTLRLLLRLVRQDVGARDGRFLLSDLMTLGGRPGLRGFTPGRFHERDLLLARLTYLFPVSRRLELALSSSLGGVYRDAWRDPKPRGLHHSFGVSLRARSLTGPVAMIGMDASPEGIRVGYGIGGLE